MLGIRGRSMFRRLVGAKLIANVGRGIVMNLEGVQWFAEEKFMMGGQRSLGAEFLMGVRWPSVMEFLIMR